MWLRRTMRSDFFIATGDVMGVSRDSSQRHLEAGGEVLSIEFTGTNPFPSSGEKNWVGQYEATTI